MFVWVKQKFLNFDNPKYVLDSVLTQLHLVVLCEVVKRVVQVYFFLQITHPAVLTYKVRNK